MLIVLEICYILITQYIKPITMADYDIFISIVSIVDMSCAFVLIHLIIHLRIMAYEK